MFDKLSNSHINVIQKTIESLYTKTFIWLTDAWTSVGSFKK